MWKLIFPKPPHFKCKTSFIWLLLGKSQLGANEWEETPRYLSFVLALIPLPPPILGDVSSEPELLGKVSSYCQSMASEHWGHFSEVVMVMLIYSRPVT